MIRNMSPRQYAENNIPFEDDFTVVLSKSQQKKLKKKSKDTKARTSVPRTRSRAGPKNHTDEGHLLERTGVSNEATLIYLKHLCSIHSPYFLLIAEPWVDSSTVPTQFWKNLNLKLFALNDQGSLSPNLWPICKESLHPVLECLELTWENFCLRME